MVIRGLGTRTAWNGAGPGLPGAQTREYLLRLLWRVGGR